MSGWTSAVRKKIGMVDAPMTPAFTFTPENIDWSRLVVLDFETFYAAGYTLSTMSTSEYVRDPRFKAQMVGIKVGKAKTKVYGPKALAKALKAIDWTTHSVLCHNTAFDGFILHHHYNIHPKRYYDTLSMARGLHSNEIGASLNDVAGYYGKGSKIEGVLESTKGVLDWPKAMYDSAALYCAQDVDLTLAIFKEMHAKMPPSEMDLINMTIRMFCNPVLRVDIPRVQAEYEREVARREALMLSIVDPRKYDDKTTLKTSAERALTGKERDMLIVKRVIGSNEKFKTLLMATGLPEDKVPKKVSPAYIKKSAEEKAMVAQEDKYTYAFAKDDLDFTNMPEQVWSLYDDLDPNDPGCVLRADARAQRLQDLIDTRIAVKSTTNITRAERFLKAGADGMPLPVGYSYYRAHTGRFGGNNKMNMQNLTRGGELRLSILAAPGHQLAVADSGQIEARVNAWLWDQNDLLDSFRLGRDIYSEFASEVYHRPITKADKTERHVGKACIAEGELVLTDRGLTPINRLSLEDKIWDGVEWVTHQGLIDQGIQEVITYDGLTATPDHEVFTEDGRIIPFGQAASEMARLQTTGAGRTGVRFCDRRVITTTPRQRLSVCQGEVLTDRDHEAHIALQLEARQDGFILGEWQKAHSECRGAGEAVRRDCGEVQQPKPQALEQLRGAGDSVPVQDPDGVHSMGEQEPPPSELPGLGDRQGEQRWALRAEESEACNAQGERKQPAQYRLDQVEGAASSAVGVSQPLWSRDDSTVRPARDVGGTHPVHGATGSPGETQELALNRRKTRVYDIANAGPRRRFTVSGKLVLNCVLGLGYQMGPDKFQMTLAKGALGGPKIAFSRDQCVGIVNTYRRKFYGIAAGWAKCTEIIEMMAAGIPGSHKCLTWGKDGDIGFIDLPNGMRLKYPDLRKSRNDKGWEEWSYQSGDMRKKMYGGLLTENLVQALARIIVMEQMLMIDKKYLIVMTTHDECVAHPKTKEAQKCYDFMHKCMTTPLWWCPTIPLAAEGGYAENYSK